MFATRRHFLRTREFNLIPSPLTERAVLNEGRVLVLNQSNFFKMGAIRCKVLCLSKNSLLNPNLVINLGNIAS